MAIRIHHLHTRIALVFVVLLLVIQVAGFSVISTAIYSNARSTVNNELAVSEKVFNQLLQSDDEKLRQAASVTAADFGFRAAVATHDAETVESALKNQGDRIRANLVMLVGLDNVSLADTRGVSYAGRTFPFPSLIASARREGSASMVGLIDGHLYQLVAVPVLAPLPIAWVAMGFEVNDVLASRLSDLTSLDVSFMSKSRDDHWNLLATSLTEQRGAQVEAAVEQTRMAPGNSELKLPDETYGARIIPLEMAGEEVVAVLQRSLDQAMAPFRHLQSILLMISVIGFVISIIGSVLTARSITKPIAALSRFAQRLGRGDYSEPVQVVNDDEIGQLAKTFNSMRDGLAEHERKILDLAYQDPLTGLPNRVLFSDRVEQNIVHAAKMGQSFALMIMDLDRFKLVNDTLGHHMGDLLLREVGARLSATLSRKRDLVSRLGGDEFAVLLPETDLEGAQGVARRMMTALDSQFIIDGHTVDVGASIGIVGYPLHGEDLNTLIRRADVAMYSAKRGNRGCAVYNAEDDQHSPARLSLMSDLRRAVENNELMLHYQPKVDLSNYSVKYVEALVRWIHPERGFIPPDHFIPFAEQTGYIKVLSRWVINEALRQCAAWHAEGLEISVSINISARDLLHAELPEYFERLMNNYQISAHWIWIEITESAVMDDPVNAMITLDRLHDLGLRLSIDDFGTGYSSLAYLKRLPVDEIKIDKSFVMNMSDDKDDMVIVRSTIDLGHNMGLKVVAEGVENEDVMRQLVALSCDLVQGYHVSRPLPAAKFTEWLTVWKSEAAAKQAQGHSGVRAA
jgi:diguanylate cyclase (GGDEF)-like protein